MASITREAVLHALSTVIEPDLKRDLVSLNMIRDVEIQGDHVAFTVVLTTPACPLKELIESMCRKAIHTYVNASAVVIVNMISEVATAPTAQDDVVPGVKNLIAVASGKGGVGKSTVAVNLAVALAKTGAKVGLVDTDIYGPSIPTMFGVTDTRPRVNDARKIIPVEKYGVKLLSMGFLIDPEQATIWRGPMVSSAVRQFLADTVWGDLDYMLLDFPPGTGDIQLTIVQTISLTGAIVVSTPQEVALADARRGVAMFQKVNVPVLGLVENMAYFTPPDLPDRKYYLFGEGGARRLAETLEVPLLGEVPIEQPVREGADAGSPIVLQTPQSPAAQAFTTIAERAAQTLVIRHAQAQTPELSLS